MHDKHPDCIDLTNCKDRNIYVLRSRNLKLGIFREKDSSFIGIRTKFGSSSLFNECHWDTGPPYGTACPLEDLGPIDDLKLEGSLKFHVEPKHVKLWCNYPHATCYYCGNVLEFKEKSASRKGAWEGCIDECSHPALNTKNYTPLFLILEQLEEKRKNAEC